MSKDKYTRIVKGLFDRTMSGQLNWVLSFEPDVYQADFPNHSLQITRCPNDDLMGDDIVIKIKNKEGMLIESFSDVSIDTSDVPGPYSAFSYMNKIYETARRQALGVDKALDEIIDDLEMPF